MIRERRHRLSRHALCTIYPPAYVRANRTIPLSILPTLRTEEQFYKYIYLPIVNVSWYSKYLTTCVLVCNALVNAKVTFGKAVLNRDFYFNWFPQTKFQLLCKPSWYIGIDNITLKFGFHFKRDFYEQRA